MRLALVWLCAGLALSMLPACSLPMLTIDAPIRSELPSATEQMPEGRIYALYGTTLYVMQIRRDGDQIRILSARGVPGTPGGAEQSGLMRSVNNDPERLFLLAPGSDNMLLQLTVSDGAGVGYQGLFARRRCQGAICVMELRSPPNMSDSVAASLGYLDGSSGVVCTPGGGSSESTVSECHLQSPERFARYAGELERSGLLNGPATMFLVPSNHTSN